MTTRYQEVGEKLRSYIYERNPSTQQLQSILVDLLPGDELLAPMQDIVKRQSFARLVENLDTGLEEAMSTTLKVEISNVYLPDIVHSVDEVVAGLLRKVHSPTKAKQSDAEKSIRDSQNDRRNPFMIGLGGVVGLLMTAFAGSTIMRIAYNARPISTQDIPQEYTYSMRGENGVDYYTRLMAKDQFDTAEVEIRSRRPGRPDRTFKFSIHCGRNQRLHDGVWQAIEPDTIAEDAAKKYC
jgi:hypothetical protein